MKLLLDVYRAVDAGVGRLLDAARDTCDVVLFALHGMGPNSSQSYLSRAMLAKALEGGSPKSGEEDPGGLIRRLRHTVPAGVQNAIARVVPTAVRDFVVAREIAGGLSWPRTRIFTLDGDLAGYWRVNLAGREACGATPADETERLVAKLADAISGFTTPDGRPLVRRMHFPTRDLSGARARFLPDVLAEWDPELTAVEAAHHPTLGTIKGRLATGRGGNHRFNGFYSHRGPRARSSGARVSHVTGLASLVKSLCA